MVKGRGLGMASPKFIRLEDGIGRFNTKVKGNEPSYWLAQKPTSMTLELTGD